MVSQLATGHRVKIGNPGAVARLQRLLSLTGEVRDGRVDAAQALAAMEQDNAEDHLLTRSSRAVSDQQGATAVRRLLEAVATPEEVAEAAELLAAAHPALAEALLVYAAGSEEEARAHYTRCTRGLAGSPAS
jgi:hypothetical protein